jgi:GNAT superfamily N-acetyltransferase
MVTVRPATLPDAPAMGRVHVRAWQAAYRGQMPDDYLHGLRPEDRAAHWEGALRREDLRGAILVAERAGEVIGFAVAGPSRDPEGAGELYAINLDPAHWGTGAGRALLQAAQAELARPGFDETVLWVLEGNARARRFYEIAGWIADGPGAPARSSGSRCARSATGGARPARRSRRPRRRGPSSRPRRGSGRSGRARPPG